MLHDPQEKRLFPTLPEASLEQLKHCGQELSLPAGEYLFREGDREYPFFAVLEGKVRITKRLGGEDQVLAIHEHGHFAGEISMLTGQPAIASAQTMEPTRVVRLEIAQLRRMVVECSQVADVILTAMASRTRDVDAQARQQEKLAALGKMSAGLAHELNNPAAAARRAAQSLQTAVGQLQQQVLAYDGRLQPAQRESLLRLQQQLTSAASIQPLQGLALSDREDELGTWLDDHDVEDAWDLAHPLAELGVKPEQMEAMARDWPPEVLRAGLTWLTEGSTVQELVRVVEATTTRIAELVIAMKEYSYMDQAAFQEVDVHHGLESTLKMFAPRLRGGIQVVREYAEGVPRLCAYVGELNQVWTNLIDNALDAMDGHGTLRLRTAPDHGGILVEIGDTGPGVPPELQTRIFEPFFTTKGVGKGTGLGLDISYRIVTSRHHGTLRVHSLPGDTRFQVWLPLAPPKTKPEPILEPK